jgi:hypothetical protein
VKKLTGKKHLTFATDLRLALSTVIPFVNTPLDSIYNEVELFHWLIHNSNDIVVSLISWNL